MDKFIQWFDTRHEVIFTFFYVGFIGMLGMATRLLYKAIRGEKMKLIKRIMHMLLAFLITRFASQFIDKNLPYYTGLLGVIGASSLDIIRFFDENKNSIFQTMLDIVLKMKK